MRLFPAAASHQLYLMDLSARYPSIWTDPGQVRLRTIKRGPTRPAHIWDLHRLADWVGDLPSEASRKSGWLPLRPEGFEDDSGSGAWKRLRTPFTPNVFTYADASAHVYTGGYRFSPLILDTQPLAPPEEESPEREVPDTRPGIATADEGGESGGGTGAPEGAGAERGEMYAAESALMRAMLHPAMPLALASTLPNHKHYGPIFLESVSLSASGQGQLGPVSVDAQFKGGKSIVLPTLLPVDLATYEEGGVAHRYRTANWGDCRAGLEEYSTVEELLAGVVEDRDAPRYQMVEMNLSASHSVEFSFPSSQQGDRHGPRYAYVDTEFKQGHSLNGSLVYFSRSDRPLTQSSSPLTLYFGGPFFFQFANVDWGEPRLSIIAGKGWFHTYDFLVRSAPNAVLGGEPPQANLVGSPYR